MKSQEQVRSEVMSYLEKSSKQFFESEDRNEYQTIVKTDKEFVFVKNGEKFPIDHEYYIQSGKGEAKTWLKRKFHPTWDVNEKYWKGYGMGPSKKPRAIRWNRERRELIDTLFKQ